MNSQHIQYRTVPSMSDAAQTLRIPTVQTKKIIRMNPSQIPALMITSTNNRKQQQTPYATFSAAQPDSISAPLSLETACGLFDVNLDNMLNESPECIANEPKFFMTNDLIDYEQTTNVVASSQPTPNNTESLPSPNSNQMCKPGGKSSKFAKKLSEMNLKIQLPSKLQEQPLTGNSLSFNLNLEDDEINKIITPGVEKACIQYLHSIPTAQLFPSSQAPPFPSSNIQPSARIITNEQMLQSIGFEEQDLAKLLAQSPQILLQKKSATENPFMSDFSASLKLNNNNNNNIPMIKTEAVPTTSSIVQLDHVYHAPPTNNKRKIALANMDESSLSYSQDSFGSSSFNDSMSDTEGGGKPSKKKRTKGIYRSKDVTNQEEYMNYLERRKKNNVSSKISRANKKNYYKDMDSKADQLEKDNRMLQTRAEILADINKKIKEELIKMYAGKATTN